MGWPKWGREGIVPVNPDLADILGDSDFDFENFHFWDFFWIPNFQISRSQISQNLALGRAWALGLAAVQPWWADSTPSAAVRLA